MLASFFFLLPIWGVSLTHPVLPGFVFYRESFSYTSCAGFIFIWGVSLTHPVPPLIYQGTFLALTYPMLASFLSGSFSFTSRVGFIFMQGISLTHPMLPSFFAQGVCLTHPVLPSLLCGEFLLHIPSCLHFYVGSFSYTSHAGFFLCVEFFLHTPSWLLFYMGSFSYTSRTGFFSCEELLSSTVYSEDNPLRKELGGSWPRRKVWKSHTQTREGSPRTTWTEQNETK